MSDTFQATTSTALILRAMLTEPRHEHSTPDIVRSTGIPRPTAMQNLERLQNAGWVESRLGERGRFMPPRIWKFTRAGRLAARAEVKKWTFSDGQP